MRISQDLRRSGRITKNVPVTLRWQAPGGEVEDDPAETLVISQHGCSVKCRTERKIGAEVFVLDRGRDKSARARVVRLEAGDRTDEVMLALEFTGPGNFWEMEFPRTQSA